jgi:chemotaxis protein methyltransferase CheR
MGQTLPNPLLAQFSEFLAARIGLHFPRERWPDLERAIESASGEFDFADTKSCVQWLLSSALTRRETEILASHLTVGETYFFREKNSFDGLEQYILPELIRSRRGTERRLRIWSAGCCTGEEPYSIAILLGKMIPDLKEWNITILATDINPRFLRKATQGVYKEWSFRDTAPGLKERYFKKTKDGKYEVPAHVKEMVTFSYLNLADDVYPSLENNTNAMDIIFCRNVLMYFEPQRAKRVAQNLYRALMEGGWLIVSPTETSHVLFSQFVTANFPGAILYKKDSNPVRIGQTVEMPSVRPVEEPVAPLQPVFESVPEPEAIQKINREFHQLEAEEQKTPAPQTPYEEAETLYEQGRYSDAAGKIRMWLSLGQSDAKAMGLLARIYANQGCLGDALEWCKKAVAADKLNPGWCYLLATILQEQGKVEEAVTILRRALYLDQNFVLAHFALGNLTRRQGKLKESQRHFDNALSLLSAVRQENILPESEGITAGRLIEIIRSTISSEALV